MRRLRTKLSLRWDGEDMDVSSVKDVTERVREGVLLHLALSLALYMDDLKYPVELVRRAMLLKREKPHEEALERLASYIERIRSLPSFPLIYPDRNKAEVIVEREFVSADGSLLKPDRVVVYSDKVVVVDYKAHKPLSGIRMKAYRDQVKRYMKLASQFFCKPVEGYLLYIKDALIERI